MNTATAITPRQPAINTWEIRAKRLKGAAASLGLRELAETAGALEADAASLTEESAPQMAQHLRTQFETAREMATRLGWLVA